MPESLEKILLTKIMLLCLAIGCDKHCHGSDWNPWPSAYESSPARPAAVASNTVAATPPLSAAPVQIPGRRCLALTPEQQARGVISCYVDETPAAVKTVVCPELARSAVNIGPQQPVFYSMPAQPCLQNYSYAAGYSTPMSYSACGPGGCR